MLILVSVSQAKDLVPKNINELEAVTVFVEATFVGKHAHMAKKLTETHADFFQHGFELHSVAVYTENSDLEGFFVSYKRIQGAVSNTK